MHLDWYIIWKYRDAIGAGLRMTFLLSSVSLVGSFLVGTAIGCFGTLPGFLPKRLVGVYVESLRNIPAVVKLFFFYYVINLDAITAALISLVLHHSPYIADVTASGLRSIPREQFDAARACGHNFRQIFIYVLVPQAMRIIIYPLTTMFIEVVKNSSVAMLITVEELTFQVQQIEHFTFRGFEAATAVTGVYLLLALAVAAVMTFLQKQLKRK